MKKGVIDEIINQAKLKYNLPDHITIKKDTIRKRMDGTRSLLVGRLGPKSLMEEIEVILLEMILSLARIQKPVMPTQALENVNSLVNNTEKEEEIKECKWKHLKLKDP